jgi:predicted glycoside hydrolase/deacetylase ChbG (UPF0249 family)
MCQRVILRIDDVGMLPSINDSALQVASGGLRISASCMPVCTWFKEAIYEMKKYPNVALGIHLTLTSEWKKLKWSPMSLNPTDRLTRTSRIVQFPHNLRGVLDQKWTQFEIETELRRQIEHALGVYSDFSYLDFHMFVGYMVPDIFHTVLKLACEYRLLVSQLHREQIVGGIFQLDPTRKMASVIQLLREVNSQTSSLFIFHPSTPSTRLKQLVRADRHTCSEGNARVSEHRTLTSHKLRRILDQPHYQLLNYVDLKPRLPLQLRILADNPM